MFIGLDARLSDCSTVVSPNRRYDLQGFEVRVKAQWLAIVPRESTLFAGTLRFNLATTYEHTDKDLAYSTHRMLTDLRGRESKQYHRRRLGNLHNQSLTIPRIRSSMLKIRRSVFRPPQRPA